jgi:hypothetical protein
MKYIPNYKQFVNESAMSELDLLAKEAKDFKSFTKEVFKEFKNLPKKADTLKWLEELYNDAINEAEKAEGDRSKLSAEIEKALKDKATESGVPIGLLRLVMRRGLDAWNSSHREGVPQVLGVRLMLILLKKLEMKVKLANYQLKILQNLRRKKEKHNEIYKRLYRF